MSTDNETIEDVRAAYALLHRDMAALRVKADALHEALIGLIREWKTPEEYLAASKAARAAIANYTGA